MHRLAPRLALTLAVACSASPTDPDPDTVFEALPAPDAWQTAGPGGPARAFAEADLEQPCTFLVGGPEDAQHHNLVAMFDGWLVHPWAPEDGGGGVSLWAFDDPCTPELVGRVYSPVMRESHTLAFGDLDGRTFLAVDYHEEAGSEVVGGIGIIDITDPTAPAWISQLALPGYDYPDAYIRVTLSTFWQGTWLFVSGGTNGVYVVDVADPAAPVLVDQVRVEGPHLVGTFHVIGNLAMSSSAGLARTVMMDVSDPTDIRTVVGGDFETEDGAGVLRPYYFSNVGGRYGLFARKNEGGGPIVYDLTDPGAPAWVGEGLTPDGDGGYVFRQGAHLFVGNSDFASRYDFADPASPIEVARYERPGDVDTITPVGNVVVVSVDSGAPDGEASAVIPWATAPDTTPPRLELTVPADGDAGQALTTRIGLSFDEPIEPRSVHPGSLRVWAASGQAVEGLFNTQENLVNFTPRAPLEPGARYRVVVPAGGIADVSGNPVDAETELWFTTGS